MKEPFLTFRETDDNEFCYFILQKAFPHYIGKLVTYPVEGGLNNSPITDHHLYITFAGCLMGNFIPAHKGELDHIAEVFSQMAEWYYTNRINPDLKKYKKWRHASINNQ